MYELKSFENGFEYIEIKNSLMSAKIALQGAHIFEFKLENREEFLWLSPVSDFERTKAIRGGIPICWPRFGVLDKDMPAHGFTRTALFKLVEVNEVDARKTEVIMRLTDDVKTRKIWNYKFELDVLFTLSDTLKVELVSKNRDTKEFMITQALHTYFYISGIADVCIKGLESREFLDTLIDEKQKEESSISIDAEIDRVYQDVNTDIVLLDARKEINIKSEGSSSVVVWNPWIEKGSDMSGMKSDGYKDFVCIETANAFDDGRVIKKGDTHTISAEYSLLS